MALSSRSSAVSLPLKFEMLLTHDFHTALAKIHRRVRYVPGIPLKWNGEQLTMKVLRNESFWKPWVSLLILILVTKIYSLREYCKHGDIISVSVGVRDHWIQKRTWQEKRNSCVDALLQLFLFTELVSPPLLGIGCGLMTCSPLNLVKGLNPRCWTSNKEGSEDLSPFLKVLKFLVFAPLNSLLWKAILGGGFAFSIHTFVAITAQCTALKEFGFQLRIYRRLQLLNHLFDHVYVGLLFVFLAGCTAAGCVFSISEKVLEEERRSCLLKCKCNWKRRQLASCRPIRIEFGVSNFIEKETPLKFLEFAIHRFVDQVIIH
ncbi:unnamed protein product [Orchesella dallaii]|uniref:Uncharacterized protein n=1 Tax=Orchesella dallaii TaxID=48710 RepID=A0ABP1S714_9HEXA